jgi:hypothetical protein
MHHRREGNRWNHLRLLGIIKVAEATFAALTGAGFLTAAGMTSAWADVESTFRYFLLLI